MKLAIASIGLLMVTLTCSSSKKEDDSWTYIAESSDELGAVAKFTL